MFKLYVIIIHKFGHCSSLIVVIFFVFSLDLNLDLLLYNPAWLSSFMCPDICVVVELSVSKHWREYEGLILTSGLASFFLYPPLDLWWMQHWSLCRYDCGGCVSTTLTSQLAPSWVTICEYCMLCWYCLCTANLLMTLWLYIDVWCTSFIYLFF